MDRLLGVGCPKCRAQRGKPCTGAKGEDLDFAHDERIEWLKNLEDAGFADFLQRLA